MGKLPSSLHGGSLKSAQKLLRMTEKCVAKLRPMYLFRYQIFDLGSIRRLSHGLDLFRRGRSASYIQHDTEIPDLPGGLDSILYIRIGRYRRCLAWLYSRSRHRKNDWECF